MPDLSPHDDMTRVALTFKRYAEQFMVDEGLLLDVDVSVQQEFFGSLVYRFRTKILTDDLPPERLVQRTRVPYEVPASTWQMWKARHARRWYARRLVARWPVRYGLDPDGRGADAVCSFDLERYRTYPRAQLRMPERLGQAVLVHAVRDVGWEVDRDA